MGGGPIDSRNGHAKPSVLPSRSLKLRPEHLVNLSNITSDSNLSLKRPNILRKNTVHHGRSNSTSNPCTTPGAVRKAGSTQKGEQSIHSENYSLYFDGPSDNGSNISGLIVLKPFDITPKPGGLHQEVAKRDRCSTKCDDCDNYRQLNRPKTCGDSEEEDLIDLTSDTESCVTESTIDPQSPRTPGERFHSSFLGAKNATLPTPSKALSLNRRLRPSQRPEPLRPSFVNLAGVDRMTAHRRPPTASRDCFLMSRSVSRLNQEQKIHRRRTGLSDPFEPLHPRSAQSPVHNPSFGERGSVQNGVFRATGVLGVRPDSESTLNRRVSGNNVWNIGGSNSPHERYSSHSEVTRVTFGSRSNVRVHTSKFLRGSTPGDDRDMHEKRLALALDVDQAEKVLLAPNNPPKIVIRSIPLLRPSGGIFAQDGLGSDKAARRMVWMDNKWMRDDRTPLLEAPLLRDDFYCSVLAYSYKADRLAVALGFKVYLWSEDEGTIEPPSVLESRPLRTAYVTSLAFSSEPGGRAILAVGRGDGRILMWSPLDREPRFLRIQTSNAAAHLSFRPSAIRRPSKRHASIMAENEVFLVGDDLGAVSVYLVEWPEDSKRFLFGWHGSVCLHARVTVHTQQICGIAWSPNGELFATGGNDNLCCLFQSSTILGTADNLHATASADWRRDEQGNTHLTVAANYSTEVNIRSDHLKNQWKLNAAVKAIAFCPWQPGLLAAGGGSNDRCIHFYHTFSGACLATIDCAAQVTALIWSKSRREIAATFGFAQPEHPFRVAVYAWPSCEQIVAIPWMSEMRALHAIAYPGHPEYGRKSWERVSGVSRAVEEGCIIIAGSDGSIKFHEIWSEKGNSTAPHQGLLGGSDILEALHGIEKEARETIR